MWGDGRGNGIITGVKNRLRMKKVCHVTSAHQRYDTRIFQKECRTLAKEYKVFLVVNDSLPDETIGNVSVLSTNLTPKNRAERFFKVKKKMMELALDVNADIYHFHDPDLIGFALRVQKKLRHCKIIFDSHEDVPAQILGKKWIPSIFRNEVSWLFMQYQRKLFPKFDYLIGVTPHLVEKLRRINPCAAMVTNYPILDTTNTAEKEKQSNVICFAGGISEQWNHRLIIDAIETLDVNYLLCGSSSEKYIESLKVSQGWEKVQYMGKLPFDEVQEIYQTANVGMAVLSSSPNTDYENGTLGNTKIFEYMQSGLPVICTDFVLWREIVEENNCGICVDPRDENAVREAIRYMIDHPCEAQKMGENGRLLVQKKYNWDAESAKLMKVYRELL